MVMVLNLTPSGGRWRLKASVVTALFLTHSLLMAMPFSGFQESAGESYLYVARIVYMNLEPDPVDLPEDLRVFSIPMNTSWQTVNLLNSSLPYTRSDDANGNPMITLAIPPIPPDHNMTASISVRVIPKEREAPIVRANLSGTLGDIPPELHMAYCGEEGSWQVGSQSLRALAYQVWESIGNSTNVLEIVSALASWVGNNIEVDSYDTPRYPSEVYDSRRGDCDDQANLLITLCRILGVPAHLQVGFIVDLNKPLEVDRYWSGRLTSVKRRLSYHGWAVVYIPPWGWLPFDMTLGWTPSNPLAGISSAPVYERSVVQMMNVTVSDWAGEGRRVKEMVQSGQLYITEESEVAMEPWSPQGSSATSLPILGASALFIILVLYWFSRRTESKRPVLQRVRAKVIRDTPWADLQ